MTARPIVLGAFLVAAAMSVGCSDSTSPEKPGVSMVFNGEVYVFDSVSASVSGSVGGPPVYALMVTLQSSKGGSIRFSVQDENNDPAALLELGSHRGTGGHSDAISNYLVDTSFGMGNLTHEQLSIDWTAIDVSGSKFGGRGFIRVLSRLELACADSVWAGYWAKPGDPEYDQYFDRYCVPGFYYPTQTIAFSVEDGDADF